jgi:hypothetical protein
MPSELNVNKISPASGTEVSLGDSGDTITIPSGVTLAGDGSNLTGVTVSKAAVEALGIELPAANLTGTIHADRYTDTVYTHPTTAGNKHIPTAGATDQVLTYSSSGTASWATPAGGGGVLQVKQFRKLTTIHNSATTDTVLAAPFDGSATINPASAGNYIRVEYHVAVDHGNQWRSGFARLEWSPDGGTTYYGLSGGSTSSFNTSGHFHGNSLNIGGIFNPNVTIAVKVRVVINGHAQGQPHRYGQYNNEGQDNTNTTPTSTNGVTSVGHYLILTELDGSICSTADTA